MSHAILTLKSATLSVSGHSFEDAIVSAALTAQQDDVVWMPISGNVVNDVSTPTYKIELEFGQDLTANSTLFGFLWTNQGTTQEVVLKPKGGTVPSVTADVVLKVPSQIGGSAQAIATATVSLPVNGTPVIAFG